MDLARRMIDDLPGLVDGMLDAPPETTNIYKRS